ncbi:MAG: hypothetical protein KKG03_03450 [Gammaproteobacteria bacterium]|nr:hypothetical protein [Sideroxydans sp.]MBU4150688.1 hypothetical protein [Gammaproteobacteria bacterium]
MDNDVLHKTTAYGLFVDMLAIPRLQKEVYGALGTARFVVRKKISKRPPSRGLEAALADFTAAVGMLKEIEPTPEEVDIAANIERLAQLRNLELDTGESILCAVMLARHLGHILTGDKRAIKALEVLNAAEPYSNKFKSKLICLEQLFIWLANGHEIQKVRNTVCADRTIDSALTSCFGCYSPEVQNESCIEGLNSYILDLRQDAPNVLV